MVYLTILGGLGQTLFPPLCWSTCRLVKTAGLTYVVANPTQIIIVVILYET
jgi:hypothetical protein